MEQFFEAIEKHQLAALAVAIFILAAIRLIGEAVEDATRKRR